MILEGTTSSGAVVPVQVTDDGKVVAEGRTGPEGPQGPEGPEGPQGPPGPDSSIWDRNGTVVSPTNAGDNITTTGDVNGAGITATGVVSNPAVTLDPGSSGSPLVRDSNGRVGIGTASPSFKTEIVDTLQADANLSYSLAIHGDDGGTVGESVQVFLGGINSSTRGAVIAAELQASGNSHDLLFKVSGTSAAPSERMRLDSQGHLTVGSDPANPAVLLDPGSTGVPLVRDSVGRLLVGMDSAPAGTLAGDVVCQGAVVLQSPNGTWWAIEVEDNGTLSVAQTTVR